MTKPTRTGQARRRYTSPRRRQHAAETRTAVLDAAVRLFAARGWTGTGIREVAREAGVAVETVYANFHSKPALLMAALDVAVVGDAAPIALAERPEFTTLGQGAVPERARAAARLVRRINERTGGIQKALREGAAVEEELAARLSEGERRRRADVAHAARLIAGRPVSETERDGLWAVTGVEVYELLARHAGWSAHRYEQWLAQTIVRLLGLEVSTG